MAQRADGLLDEPRPGAPRTITDAQVERVVALTLEATPRDATHWSTRALAVWPPPHRSETFKLSRDPLFIDKVRDIVGLYLNPPDRALVLVCGHRAVPSAAPRRRVPEVP